MEVGECSTCISACPEFIGDPGAALPPQPGHGLPAVVAEKERVPFSLAGREASRRWEAKLPCGAAKIHREETSVGGDI